MARTQLLTMDDLLGAVSPERQAAWARLTLARAVANALVAYRGEHKLSQRALAANLGVRPSVVGRLELAEHNPTIETLQHLSRGIGLRLAFEVVPPGRDPEYLTGAPDQGDATQGDATESTAATRLLVVAAA